MQRKNLIWPHEINTNNEQNKYVWSRQDLLDQFKPLWKELARNPSSYAFRDEVNPELMGIPEYRTIIKHPMSLNTIRSKFESESYEEPWEVVNDFWLIFNNAMLFNKPSTNIYKECVKLLEIFKDRVNILMKQLGFCCGMKYTFEPQTLACNLCDPNNPSCAIYKGDEYFFYKVSDEDTYQVCKPCFNKQSDSFIISTDTPRLCHKHQFKSAKNDIVTEENFISCSRCCRNWHTICAVHISTPDNPFFCHRCKSEGKIPQNAFSAERIPTTELSQFIEQRVNYKFANKELQMNKVVVRVLADTSHSVQIKPEILEHYTDKSFTSLPYQSKAIYAFQNIDGFDILFFALFTQEYGGECPAPNTRTVYISYLDSVHYFRPAEYRTEVYHEILISYLCFCRDRQFLTAHLWACPPGSGDDYVFHQHPPTQKVPKRQRLINWYKAMLDKAVLTDVAIEYMNIYEYMLKNNISHPSGIPYFDGDFWPNAISEMLTNEASQLQLQPTMASKKRKLILGSNHLHTHMLQLAKKFNEEFLVVLLNLSHDIDKGLKTITTSSLALRNTDLVEQRDSLLFFCREYNLEFSSLRRAKFTTMRILDELFRDNQKGSFDCDVCKQTNLADRYTCSLCLDYDLCPICYDKLGHEHDMERVYQTSEQITLADMLKLLNEAVRCKGCRSNRCVMMKLLLVHAQTCALSYEQCADCYRFTLLMVQHAHYCRDVNCRIAFCREKRDRDKKREARRVLQQRYTEKCRYQATKRNSGLTQADDAPVVITENMLRLKAREFSTIYPDRNECKRQFNIFLDSDPNYKAAYNHYMTQRQIQNECTQLGKSLPIATNINLQNDPKQSSKENVAPVIVKTERKRSDYFIKPLLTATPAPTMHHFTTTKIEFKPLESAPPVPPQTQKTTKKRVQISHQN